MASQPPCPHGIVGVCSDCHPQSPPRMHMPGASATAPIPEAASPPVGGTPPPLAADAGVPVCVGCGTPQQGATHKVCPICMAIYCSKECFARDWKSHRKQHKKAEAPAEVAPPVTVTGTGAPSVGGTPALPTQAATLSAAASSSLQLSDVDVASLTSSMQQASVNDDACPHGAPVCPMCPRRVPATPRGAAAARPSPATAAIIAAFSPVPSPATQGHNAASASAASNSPVTTQSGDVVRCSQHDQIGCPMCRPRFDATQLNVQPDFGTSSLPEDASFVPPSDDHVEIEPSVFGVFSDDNSLASQLPDSQQFASPEPAAVGSSQSPTGITIGQDTGASLSNPSDKVLKHANIPTAVTDAAEGVGKLIHRSAFNPGRLSLGVGGGILVARDPDLFLVKLHCIGDALPTDYVVGFGHQGRYNDPVTRVYPVVAAFSGNSTRARKLGITAGPYGDLLLLQLGCDNDTGRLASENHRVFQLKPLSKDPSKIFFVGYTNGSQCKTSSLPGRPLELLWAVRDHLNEILFPQTSDLPLRLCWGGSNGCSQIFRVHTVKLEDDNIVFETVKVGTNVWHVVVVPLSGEGSIQHTYSSDPHNKRLSNKHNFKDPSEVYWLRPAKHMDGGRIVVAAKTGSASCGGVYFTDTGDVFALHYGLVLNTTSQRFPDHIGYIPWLPNSRYTGPLLQLEAKNSVQGGARARCMDVYQSCAGLLFGTHQLQRSRIGWCPSMDKPLELVPLALIHDVLSEETLVDAETYQESFTWLLQLDHLCAVPPAAESTALTSARHFRGRLYLDAVTDRFIFTLTFRINGGAHLALRPFIASVDGVPTTFHLPVAADAQMYSPLISPTVTLSEQRNASEEEARLASITCDHCTVEMTEPMQFRLVRPPNLMSVVRVVLQTVSSTTRVYWRHGDNEYQEVVGLEFQLNLAAVVRGSAVYLCCDSADGRWRHVYTLLLPAQSSEVGLPSLLLTSTGLPDAVLIPSFQRGRLNYKLPVVEATSSTPSSVSFTATLPQTQRLMYSLDIDGPWTPVLPDPVGIAKATVRLDHSAGRTLCLVCVAEDGKTSCRYEVELCPAECTVRLPLSRLHVLPPRHMPIPLFQSYYKNLPESAAEHSQVTEEMMSKLSGKLTSALELKLSFQHECVNPWWPSEHCCFRYVHVTLSRLSITFQLLLETSLGGTLPESSTPSEYTIVSVHALTRHSDIHQQTQYEVLERSHAFHHHAQRQAKLATNKLFLEGHPGMKPVPCPNCAKDNSQQFGCPQISEPDVWEDESVGLGRAHRTAGRNAPSA